MECYSYALYELTRIQVYMRERYVVLRDCGTRFNSSKDLPGPWLNICMPHPFLTSGREGGLLIFLPHSSFNLRRARKLDEDSCQEVRLCQHSLT